MPSLEAVDHHWMWLALGLVLAAAEMVLPGVFLIWMAGAAILTGLVAWVVPVGVPMQIVLFALLALIAVFGGRRYLRAHPVESADPLLNDRGGRAVGETVTVTQAISGGSGRVRMGDGEWIARGPDAAPGTRMRVTGHDGVVLLVEPIG